MPAGPAASRSSVHVRKRPASLVMGIMVLQGSAGSPSRVRPEAARSAAHNLMCYKIFSKLLGATLLHLAIYLEGARLVVA